MASPTVNALDRAMRIPGALAVSVIDLGTGESLGALGASPQYAASWAELGSAVLRASAEAIHNLTVQGDLEELVIGGSRCFHLFWVVSPNTNGCRPVVHLAVDRSRVNLAMARLDLKAIVESEWRDALADGSRSIPALPRRDPGRTAHREPLVDESGGNKSVLAGVAGLSETEPDVETLRRIAEGLNALP